MTTLSLVMAIASRHQWLRRRKFATKWYNTLYFS